MRKLLFAVVMILGVARLAHAVCDHRTTTCFTAIDVSGAASVGSLTNAGDSTVTGNFAVTGTSTLTGNVAVTGTSTLTGKVTISTASMTTTSLVSATPAAAGLIVRDSNYLVYISTCTTASTCWNKIGGQ